MEWRKVIRIDDDSPTPMVGVVLWQEDEDRYAVAWGDEAYADEPKVRIEYHDDITPFGGVR